MASVTPGFRSSLQAGVVGADRLVERLLGVESHLLLDMLSPLGVDVVAVARRVELNVFHAVGDERLDLGLDDRHDVPEKLPSDSDRPVSLRPFL